VIWHSWFFESLLHKLVEILNTDELLDLSPSMIVLILVRGYGELNPSSDYSDGVRESDMRRLQL